MPSSDKRKKKKFARIADSENQRKSFASAKKQRDELGGDKVCIEGVVQIFTNFYDFLRTIIEQLFL